MKSRLPQLFRLALLAAALLLIHHGPPAPEAATPPPWPEIQRWFPPAASLSAPTAPRQSWPVLDAGKNLLGHVLRTAPQTDALIGYAGPNDLLIAEKPDGTLLGVSLLHSADTPDHADLVRRDPNFLSTFTGWNPASQTPPQIQAVSGATLTSLTMAEAVLSRLGEAPSSLKFPTPPTLPEILPLFPTAATFDGRTARDASAQILGHILRTSPASDSIPGYSGPTECLIALEPDAATVRDVIIRKSYDTPDYVDQIREDFLYLRNFKGRTLTELAALDFATEKVQGVSGATLTSYAIAEGLKRRAAQPDSPAKKTAAPQSSPAWSWRDTLLALTIAGASLIAFTPLRGRRRVRLAWQAWLIFYLGLAAAQLLPVTQLTGWADHGIPWKNAPALVLLATAALLIPWATGRQVYCHQLCPHGAAQQWLGKLSRKKIAVPPALGRWLERLPGALLILAFLTAIGAVSLNLSAIEPFNAWAWRAAGPAALILAAAGLILAIFIPQAYCRYGCPTGALLKWIRHTGPTNHLSTSDAIALLCVLAAFFWTWPKRHPIPNTKPPAQSQTQAAPTAAAQYLEVASQSNPSKPLTLAGHTMGTTWSATFRHPALSAEALRHGIQSRLDAIENMLSTWRPDTPLSRFNASRQPGPIPVAEEILTLVRQGRFLSEATDGAYDLTTGPLVKAWNFGPPPRGTEAPSPDHLRTLLGFTGYQKIVLPPTLLSLTGLPDSLQAPNPPFPFPPGTPIFLFPGLSKTVPETELDLNSLAEGHALDRIRDWLHSRSCQDFLLEIGGEFHASGSWNCAVDFPWQTFGLTNSALATSGSYRQFRATSAGRSTHLIDPRSGQPVAHATRCVSVIAPDGLTADSWATALTIPPPDKALAIARRHHLAARFVTEPVPGQLQVTTTPEWDSAARPLTLSASAAD